MFIKTIIRFLGICAFFGAALYVNATDNTDQTKPEDYAPKPSSCNDLNCGQDHQCDKDGSKKEEGK